VPRLTNDQYINHHIFLRHAWIDFPQLYVVVPMDQQREVHRYFQQAKNLCATELLEYRKRITIQEPDLPAQAGKAFTHMYTAYEIAERLSGGDHDRFKAVLHQLTRQHAKTSTGPGRRVRIAAVANPELDLEKFARLVIEIAKEMARDQNKA
jgi:hypothetical protein